MKQGTLPSSIPARSRLQEWTSTLLAPVTLGLALLLGLQLAAALLLGAGGNGTLNPTAADTALLPFDAKTVTAVRIEGGGQSALLARGDKGWLIADLGDFPADGAKIDQLLEKLAALKRPLPVATSREALKRHKVADEGFERKITLESGDTPLAALLLGDSPGFKRQLVRVGGESAVYDVELPLFEVSNRHDDWLTRDQLQVDQEQIKRISAADWTLIKGQDGWQLEGTDEKPDAAAVTNLLGRISSLSYRGVLGTQNQPEYNQAAPTLDLRLQLADGSTREYRISKVKDGADSVLKVADRPWYFKLSDMDLDGLVDVTRDQLLGKAPAAAAQDAGNLPAGGEAAVAEELTPTMEETAEPLPDQVPVVDDVNQPQPGSEPPR
ncbi:DUF4340 domain-containing protein [uncultured Lamprocystis sp.]|nr:DUF4340 domain-containing protein [uncultured Lamprocystis sp.]